MEYIFIQRWKNMIILNVFDGIELKTFGKEDLNKWNKIKDKLYELKDIRYDLEAYNLIEKIKNFDEFDTFIKIMHIDKDTIYERSYEKKLISYLGEKFMSLISACINHEYFSRIASILIYKYDQLNLQPEILICDIEKQINKNGTSKIYIYLANNYYLESEKLIRHMADYIINKKLIPIIKSLENIKKKIIPVIFNNIDNCITKEMLYDNMQLNTYFNLLNDMNQEGYKDFSGKNISGILKNLEMGMVSYELMKSINDNYSKKELFKEKISILLFRNESKITSLIKSVKYYLDNNNNNLKNLAELKEMIEKYYYNYHSNISLIDKTVNTITKGLLNEIKKAPTKDDLAKLNKIFNENDFHRQYILKDSLVFKYENNNRGFFAGIDQAFKNGCNRFNELAVLFTKNWQVKIKNETIYNYYNIIKNTKEDGKSENTLEEKLKKDLEILSNYHDLHKKDSEINELRDEIINHINYIDIQRMLNKILSNYDSNCSPSKNKFKIKLQNILEYLDPKDSSDKEKLMTLFLEDLKNF